jgi:hypothetical protein
MAENTFRVNAEGNWSNFWTLEAARAFAEKVSWNIAKPVIIHCPDGSKVTVDITK